MSEVISEKSEALLNQEFYYSRVEKDHFWNEARMLALLDELQVLEIDLNGKKGLEVGCGNCLVSSQIEEKYNCTMDGLDLNQPAQRFPIRGEFFQADLAVAVNSMVQNYDFIVLFDVLEHISNPVEFLSHLGICLKPGGFLFINVPAYNIFFSRYDEVAGHLRRYHQSMLNSEVEGAKIFEKVHLYYWGFFLVPLLALRKLILSLPGQKSSEEIYNRGFKPPHPFVNYIFRLLTQIERVLLPRTTFGSSLIGIYKKKNSQRVYDA